MSMLPFDLKKSLVFMRVLMTLKSAEMSSKISSKLSTATT